MTRKHHGIDNLELCVADIARSKTFYGEVFGFTFQDYGPTYTSFSDGRLEGGFSTDGTKAPGGPLIILYSQDLPASQAAVERAGGRIVKPPFDFPGGRRFHFADPDGHELAVWTEV
jgi:hypothetical protein